LSMQPSKSITKLACPLTQHNGQGLDHSMVHYCTGIFCSNVEFHSQTPVCIWQVYKGLNVGSAKTPTRERGVSNQSQHIMFMCSVGFFLIYWILKCCNTWSFWLQFSLIQTLLNPMLLYSFASTAFGYCWGSMKCLYHQAKDWRIISTDDEQSKKLSHVALQGVPHHILDMALPTQGTLYTSWSKLLSSSPVLFRLFPLPLDHPHANN
jgi:hypothetical protein